MTAKTVTFKQPTKLDKPAENWVQAKPAKQPIGPIKRLTVDIPEELHRRIKIDCATQGHQISDVVRDILNKAYPKS